MTNVGKKERYFDQIAFMTPKAPADQLIKAGAFNFFDVVYREKDEALYIDAMGKRYHENAKGVPRDAKGKSSYFKTYWRTHQMSDHLPLWAALKIDFGREYLDAVKG